MLGLFAADGNPYLRKPKSICMRLPWGWWTMTFNELTKMAAKEAETAVSDTMRRYKHGLIHDEDDKTGVLVGSLQTQLDHSTIDGVVLTASILRHRRGVAAEERRYGADMLIHVRMDTPTQTYSKGVLVQAKRKEPYDSWSRADRDELVTQCNRMLAVTAAGFVFNYSQNEMRCGAATRVAGGSLPQSLNYLCGWTSYRFFLELFRCPIGDPKITSARVDDLAVPFGLEIKLSGDIDLDEGASSR
jgi:hypothetical protein